MKRPKWNPQFQNLPSIPNSRQWIKGQQYTREQVISQKLLQGALCIVELSYPIGLRVLCEGYFHISSVTRTKYSHSSEPRTLRSIESIRSVFSELIS